MHAAKVRQSLVKLKLLELGKVADFEALDDYLAPSVVFDDIENTQSSDLEARLLGYEELYLQFVLSKNKNNKSLNSNKKRQNDVVIRTMQRSVIESFIKIASNIKKCENCGVISQTYRKDGYAKIFQKPLNARNLKAMRVLKKKVQVRIG